MSTLWTPSGEHRVPPPEGTDQPKGPAGTGMAPPAGGAGGGAGRAPAGYDREPTPEEVREAEADFEAMREQLLEAPVEVVIANHAMGIWELAALHLSAQPPQLAQAQLAIDALTALVDGLHGRLGDAERTLEEGLSQIRMAYLQIHRAAQAQAGPAPS